MKKGISKKVLIVVSLLFIFFALITLYIFPIIPGISPFMVEKESYYFRYDLVPTVEATLPKGWSLKTYNGRVEEQGEKLTGIVNIEIYKEKELVSEIYAVTDTGGAGGTYYNFQDSDPEISSERLEASLSEDPNVEYIEVGENEYSKLTIFGLESRRIGNDIVPNVNEKETYYFTNPLDPVLFYFEDEGIKYKVFYNNEESLDMESKYGIAIYDGFSEEDLKELDGILNTLEVK